MINILRLVALQNMNVVGRDPSTSSSTQRTLRDAKLGRASLIVRMIDELCSLEIINDEIQHLIRCHVVASLDRYQFLPSAQDGEGVQRLRPFLTRTIP